MADTAVARLRGILAERMTGTAIDQLLANVRAEWAETEQPIPYVLAEPAEAACDGFRWIGQPLSTCDGCGRPAWEHAGMHVYPRSSGPFDTIPGWTKPWAPGEADAIRAKWEVADGH